MEPRDLDSLDTEQSRDFLNAYVENAKRTEPSESKKVTDVTTLALALGMFISSGNVLDQLKKHTFYGKPIDEEKMKKDVDFVNGCSENLLDRHMERNTFMHYLEELPVNERLYHAVIGIATEATELVEALKDGFPDDVNVLEELGDLNWYEAIAIDELEGEFSEVLKRNISKLRHRYPEKFTAENAIKRDTKGERQILSTLGTG